MFIYSLRAANELKTKQQALPIERTLLASGIRKL